MIVTYNNYLILTTLSKSNIYCYCLTTKRKIIAILFPSITVYLHYYMIAKKASIILRIDTDWKIINCIQNKIETDIDRNNYISFITSCNMLFKNKPC